LTLLMAAVGAFMDLLQARREDWDARQTARTLLRNAGVPVLASALTWAAVGQTASLAVQALLTLMLVTSMGPLIYRLAYRSLADSSVLVLLIVSVGVHFALTGLGLLFFGAEGFRNPPFWDERFTVGPWNLSGQTLIIFAASITLIVALFIFFDRTLQGKALRATSVNRTGARLMGISTDAAGTLSMTMAAFIGALSGLLIAPSTTLFYDSGFLIGLKGFVAAVFAGLTSFPLALAGAVGVGLIEAFGSFWASAFKEVIVFTAILPVLLWRSFVDPDHEGH
jgi:branched-chain amino acid transport system permease protein